MFKNRNLDNVILVDNAAYSYFFQLENGVPIVPYYDDKHDQELVMLMAYIRECISNCEKSNSSQMCIRDRSTEFVIYLQQAYLQPHRHHYQIQIGPSKPR